MTPRRRTRTAALRTRMMNVAIFGLVSRSAPNWSGIGLGIADPISWRSGRPVVDAREFDRAIGIAGATSKGKGRAMEAREARGEFLCYIPRMKARCSTAPGWVAGAGGLDL